VNYDKQTKLFLCKHNAVRSQMAERFVNARFGDRYEAHSAGNEPNEMIREALNGLPNLHQRLRTHSTRPKAACLLDRPYRQSANGCVPCFPQRESDNIPIRPSVRNSNRVVRNRLELNKTLLDNGQN